MNLAEKYKDNDSIYITHALNEFKYAGWMDENGNFDDEMQELICDNALEILAVLSKQGHSGTSHNYLMKLLRKLANFEVITPLTCKDDEWNKLTPTINGTAYQNKRDSRVFKKDDGSIKFSEGRIFVKKKSNMAFGTGQSITYITDIPFIPKTEYIYLEDGLTPEMEEQIAKEEEEKHKIILEKIKNGTYIKEDDE